MIYEPQMRKKISEILDIVLFQSDTSGLYYKCITIVIDAPSVVSEWRSKF
jgi:hypothetical protein